MSKDQSWEERFDKEFVDTTPGMTWNPDYDDFKAFMAEELKKQAEAMIEYLEGQKKDYSLYVQKNDRIEGMGYNQAVREISHGLRSKYLKDE